MQAKNTEVAKTMICNEPRRANKRVQPTGWIGAILASGSSKTAFPIYECRIFQPAADAQAVRPLCDGVHRLYNHFETESLEMVIGSR